MASAVAILGAATFAATEVAADDPIELRMIGSWTPETSADARLAIQLKDEVNRLSDGRVQINFQGASEVIPMFDQPEALVRGLFDVWYGAPNYWAGIVPAGYITELSPYDIVDQGPGSDLFALMTDIYEEAGIQYLGHFGGSAEFGNHYLMTQDEVNSLEDLAGMQIRVPPLTRHFFVEAGAEPITMPPGEIYVALERGTVDGFTWPYFDGFTAFGWHEVSRYLIDQPLYRNGVTVKMNKESWDNLPEDVQDIFMEAIENTQTWALGYARASQEWEKRTMVDAGMQVIELSDEESQRWMELSRERLWRHFEEEIDEAYFEAARELMSR